jgi:flagellar motor switch protein FliM
MANNPKLTQRDIDAFMNGLSSTVGPDAHSFSETPGGVKVKSVDLSNPEKFSREQIRVLEHTHDHMARRLGTALSAYLRQSIQVNILPGGVEQTKYDEYLNQVPPGSLLYPVQMFPIEAQALIELHSSIAFVLIDLLLGGLGEGMPMGKEQREFSELETVLIEPLIWDMVSAMKDAWSKIEPALDPRLGDMTATKEFLSIAMATDTVLAITFELRVGNNELSRTGVMRLCLPDAVFSTVMNKLTMGQLNTTSRAPSLVHRILLADGVERAQVPIVAMLGETKVTMRDLMDLQAGDVLPLDAPVTQPLRVLVAGQPKFVGRPGLIGNRLGVQIEAPTPTGVDPALTAALHRAHEQEREMERSREYGAGGSGPRFR